MARGKGRTAGGASADAGAAALDAAHAHLRTVAPKAFTRERGALARSLREQGFAAEAARLKKARRPSASVWAVNALATRDAETLQRVLNDGAKVRLAQRRVVSGMGRTELRDAGRAFSEAVLRALDRARERLKEAGEASGPAVTERIRQTLLASAEVDEEHRAALLKGRLEEDLSPVGFGFAPPLRVLEGGARKQDPAAPAANGEAERLAQEREAQKRRRGLAEKEVARAQQSLEKAEAGYQRLDKIAKAAEARAEAARARAEDASSAVAALREALEAARKRLDET